MTIIDAALSTIGVQQALTNAHTIFDLNITRVWVSPMRRAMQTAIHMFKGHPNIAKINFLVVPQVHEWVHCSNDLPMDVNELIKIYGQGSAEAEGLHFDFTWLFHYAQPQLWSILSMHNVERQSMILSKLKNGYTYKDFIKTSMSVLMQFPKSYECEEDVYNRAQAFKKQMKAYFTANPLPKGEKMAVVCHSKFICALTSSGVGDDGLMKDFKWA